MKVYKHKCDEYSYGRIHPWTTAEFDSSHRYYNFKEHPDLIRTVLEDLVPWAKWPAIAEFYRIIEWINSDDSALESNDCAFRGPGPNKTPSFQKEMECSGRLMILYRNLRLNTSKEHVEWLEGATHFYLDRVDPEFEWGVIGTTIADVKYVTLPVPEERKYGFQLAIKFWSWGNSEGECMLNCDRLLKNLSHSLRGISTEIKESREP